MRSPEVWEHFLGTFPSPANTSSVSSSIRTATAASVLHAASASKGKKRSRGKAAVRTAAKNACHVLDYLENLEAAESLEDLEAYMEREAVQIARVTRQSGAVRLKVTLQDGATDVDVIIAGSVRFKGKAATKGDRSNCMTVGDLVVLHGPQAAGKIPRELVAEVQTSFDTLGVGYPKGFFAPAAAAAAAEPTDLGFEWEDETEAPDAKKVLTTSAATKPKGKKRGGGGGAAADAEFDIDDI